MWLALIRGINPKAVVPHGDLGTGIRVPCPDGDMQRIGIQIHSVLDGFFHDGLKGQRRQTELGIWRIPIHDKHIAKLNLLYSQVSTGVLQLLGKGNSVVVCDGIKILAQIVGEIHRGLTCFFRIEHTKAVDAHQGIIDEISIMRWG